MLQYLNRWSRQKVDCVRIAQSHGQVAQNLLLSPFYIVQEPLQLARPLDVDVLLPDAGVQAPRELVARIHRNDVLDFEVVQGHQQFGAQRAVVHVARAQKEGTEELEDHIVEFDAVADHVGQFLDHFSLPTYL